MFSYAQNNVMITFITILIVLDEYVGIWWKAINSCLMWCDDDKSVFLWNLLVY